MSAGETRTLLGVPEKARVVLITMGGIAVAHRLDQLEKARNLFFVIPGGSQSHEVRGHLVLLPFSSDFYHPDLVNASDAVVCKIGYSTVAESYHARVPVCYVTRPEFRESETLEKFIERHMRGRAICKEEFESGSWLNSLEELLAEPRPHDDERPNGAVRVAAFLCSLLEDNARAAYD
jgi:UDP-N-acetylglucosamine:LPS N-acetylglucosamine transferase